MLNELFELLPEYVAFQILTYISHPDAILIKEFWWKRMHNIGMRKVDEKMTHLTAEMREVEEDLGVDFGGFYNYYMYNQSPQQFNNISNVMINGGWFME